jgi:hypothetical protein
MNEKCTSMKKNDKTKNIIFLLFLLGLAGGIFFMPMQINGRYTCFYHRMFDAGKPVTSRSTASGKMESNQKGRRPGEAFPERHTHDDDMVEMYINRYAFFWWSSMALLIYCLFRLRIRRHPGTEKLSYKEEKF